MVHIINGEIVQDDDPRVKSRLQQRQQPSGPVPRRSGGIAGLGGIGQGPSTGSPPPQPPGPGGPGGASPLQGLARSLGLEGVVVIPAITLLGLPAKPVEKIHLAVAALLVFLFGWRALVFLAFAYVLSLQQPATAQPPPGAPPQHAQRRL